MQPVLHLHLYYLDVPIVEPTCTNTTTNMVVVIILWNLLSLCYEYFIWLISKHDECLKGYAYYVMWLCILCNVV